MENHSYPAIAIIKKLLQVVGLILAVGGFIMLFIFLIVSFKDSGEPYATANFFDAFKPIVPIFSIVCMLSSVPMFAFAEILQVIVDIEKNTRLSIPPSVSSTDSVTVSS